jgi:hypothetical protein
MKILTGGPGSRGRLTGSCFFFGWPLIADRRVLLLKVRMKRRTGELRHLRLALFHDPLELLGAEDASICAHEYSILVVVWHILLLSTSCYGSPGTPDGCLKIVD